MKIGIGSQTFSRFLPGGDSEYLPSIRKCAQMGYEAIDLNLNAMATVKNHRFAGADWLDRVKETRDALAEVPISMDQAHAPFFNVFHEDMPDFTFKMALCSRAVQIAGMLGVKWLVFHPETLYNNPSLKATREANLERFRPLAELAAQSNTVIALENIFDPYYYTEYHHLYSGSAADLTHISDGKMRFRRRYCTYPEELCDLVDALAAEFPGHVGVCWDTGHANETMLDQEASLRLVGSRLVCLHVNDNLGVYDDHQIPYFGTIDWQSVLCGLNAAGYKGNFSYEIGISLRRIPSASLYDDMIRYALKVAQEMRRQFLALPPAQIP